MDFICWSNREGFHQINGFHSKQCEKREGFQILVRI
jgi:hypothetical protein